MLPELRRSRHEVRATPEEHKALLVIRREVLDSATSQKSLEGPLPVPWRSGWTSTIKTLGRSLDGSLLATVTARGPGGEVVQLRKVRLVPKVRLPFSLGRE